MSYTVRSPPEGQLCPVEDLNLIYIIENNYVVLKSKVWLNVSNFIYLFLMNTQTYK